jgi:alanine dehydrogenase
VHIFYKNNEIAGYAAIIHVLQLLGVDGHYGPRRNVIIMGYGSVSRGAIYALQGRGFNNIHVYTARPTHLVRDQNPDVYYEQYFVSEGGQVMAKRRDGEIKPLIEILSEADIICNAILQDTDNPTMFVREDELEMLKPRSTIIDISCDEGMGFYFAKSTTFEEPTFKVGDNITYYSVDHIPSYLWNAASREISRAIIPYLEVLGEGINRWKNDNTIERSLEIEKGAVKNLKILRYQNRQSEYPYPRMNKTR